MVDGYLISDSLTGMPVLNCEKIKVLKTDNFGLTTLSACYNMVLSTKLFVNSFANNVAIGR